MPNGSLAIPVLKKEPPFEAALSFKLLAGFALFAIHHGFDGAGFDFGLGELLFCWFGGLP